MPSTRLNLVGVGSPGAFAFSGSWSLSASAFRWGAPRPGGYGSGGGTVVSQADTSASRQQIAIAQFAAGPLKAQTISGNVKGQIQALESDAAADAYLACILRIMDDDFATSRGTLYASDLTATTPGAAGSDTGPELATAATNRKLPPGWAGSGKALTSQTAQDGDYLVLEVGARFCNTVTTSYTASILTKGDHPVHGYAALPEDESETGSAFYPWLEFDSLITFGDVELFDPGFVEIPQTLALWPDCPEDELLAGQLWPRGFPG